MQKHITTVTQDGMTVSQPGVSVSTTIFEGNVTLNVHRSRNLKNKFGGIGVSAKCDAYGMKFKTSDEAFAYAYSHGYLQVFHTPASIRQRRVNAAVIPKKAML